MISLAAKRECVLEEQGLTVLVVSTVKLFASASQPTMRLMSWINCFVSRAVVDWDRNWESFARRQGCVETCTLSGNEPAMAGIRRSRARLLQRWVVTDAVYVYTDLSIT